MARASQCRQPHRQLRRGSWAAARVVAPWALQALVLLRLARVAGAEGSRDVDQCSDAPAAAAASSVLQKGLTFSRAFQPGGPFQLGQQAPSSDQAQVSTVVNIGCNENLHAPSGSCPDSCPFMAPVPGQVCVFTCVKSHECETVNPDTGIADYGDMICRACKVPGCGKCAPGGEDKCRECSPGYAMDPSTGACQSKLAWVKKLIFCIVGVVLLVLLSWYIRTVRRPIVNENGMMEGLVYRAQLKLRMPMGQIMPGMNVDHHHEHSRHMWPLSTSLHDVPVGGPGLVMHFNFQLAIIAWGCMCVTLWTLYSYSTDIDLLTIGMHDAQTPAELCAMTLHGKKLQLEMMSFKVWFLCVMYCGTFAGSLGYAAYNSHRYCTLDDQQNTMVDYAAVVTGIPRTPGTERLEEQLKEALAQATGETVVGVSVGWDYRDDAELVMAALERDADDEYFEVLAKERCMSDDSPRPLRSRPSFQSVSFFEKIDALFGFGPGYEKEPPPELGDVRDMVTNVYSSDSAFVTFESQRSRDDAVKKVNETGGVRFGSHTLAMKESTCEPESIQWQIFSIPTSKVVQRSLCALVAIIVAVLVWALCFYYPYAYYESSFNAASGEEPGFLADLTFSMLVVAGNQAMYFLCNEIAYRVGFRFGDNAQAFYIAIYTFACFCNVLVDMSLELWLCYHRMVGVGVHTADGRLLSELTSYQEIFESYPMQKFMGARIFAYAFPSTFIIPFIMEPIFAIYVPYHLMAILLRSHAGVRGREAEKSMDIFTPMDMGRYGDLSLNVIILSFIFMFPTGRMLPLFLALVICHSYVYAYDKYRVLRCVPHFHISSFSVEWCGQRLLIVPTSFLVVAIVFKGNCLESAPYCIHGHALVGACVGAMALHILVHWLLLDAASRWGAHVANADTAEVAEQYSKVASENACNWFTANPMHCLRSKHFYQHSPPCNFYFHGREYLLKKNEELGLYYERSYKEVLQEAVEEEEEDEEVDKSVLSRFSGAVSFHISRSSNEGN